MKAPMSALSCAPDGPVVQLLPGLVQGELGVRACLFPGFQLPVQFLNRLRRTGVGNVAEIRTAAGIRLVHALLAILDAGPEGGPRGPPGPASRRTATHSGPAQTYDRADHDGNSKGKSK